MNFVLLYWDTLALFTRTIVRCHIYLNESYQAIAPWLEPRWSIEIDSFNVNVKYFEGNRNVVADFLSRIDGDVLSADVLENCENLTTKESEAMMVTTRSAKDKLNLNDIDLTIDNEVDNDDVNVDKNENDGNNDNDAKLTEYVTTFQEISWTIDELIAEQNRDPF